MQKIFIIEHLEPELYEWCLIEYENISKIVGKENLWFTNIKKKEEESKLLNFGSVFSKSVKEMNLENSCILDPESNVLLSPENSSPIKYFIFGGILGDYPPRKRTELELSNFMKEVKTFNIEKEQMSTDNAVYTVKKIVVDKVPFSNLKFKDTIEIKINSILTTELPYRYNLIDGKPMISPALVKLIIKRDSE